MSPGAGIDTSTTMPDGGPDVWDQWGNDYRFCRGVWIASLVIALYDNLLCAEEEFRFMKRSAFGWNKFLYLLNRYWPTANLIFDNIVLALYEPSTSFCIAWMNFLCYSAMIMHLSIGLILILRIYAMYSRNRTLLVVLLVMFLAQLALEMWILVPNALRSSVFTLPAIFTGCIPHNPAAYLWAYWIPMAVLEITLCILAVGKTIVMCRNSPRRPPILSVLLRDSVLYFGGVLTIIIANLVIWASARPSLFDAFVGTAFAVHSILGCRILLNLQKIAPRTEDDEDDESDAHHTLSAVALTTFAPRTNDFVATDNIYLSNLSMIPTSSSNMPHGL